MKIDREHKNAPKDFHSEDPHDLSREFSEDVDQISDVSDEELKREMLNSHTEFIEYNLPPFEVRPDQRVLNNLSNFKPLTPAEQNVPPEASRQADGKLQNSSLN